VLNGHYRERCGRSEGQYSPFTLMFRPAGVPHQDEIGPRGVRLFEIELRPAWQKRLSDCSAVLDTPRDDIAGGPLFWLAMKLFREVETPPAPEDLAVERLLAEIPSHAARSAQRETGHVACDPFLFDSFPVTPLECAVAKKARGVPPRFLRALLKTNFLLFLSQDEKLTPYN
jgi:hypothetical protein